MRKVRYRNDTPDVKRDYVYCIGRPNKPQLKHVICENRCKGYKNCRAYSEWYEYYYGEELEIEKPKQKKSRIKRKKGG